MSHFKHIIESATYEAHIHSLLEPDMLLTHGKMKREPNGIAVLQQAENRVKADPNWREKEREFQKQVKRQYNEQ